MIRSLVALFVTFLSSSPALSADETVEPWRTRLPAYNDNFIYLGDIAPHVERLLSSPRLKHVVAAAPTSASGDLAEKRLTDFRQNVGRVPVAAVLATGSSTYETIGQAGRALLLGALANASEDDGDQKRLRREAAELIEAVKLPRLGAWVEFRDPALPTQALAIARGAIGGQARQGLEVEQGDTWIEIETRVASFVPAALIKTLLPRVGLAESWNDPAGDSIAEHLAGLRLRARLEQDGSTLTLRLGPEPPSGAASRPIPVVESVWRPGPEQVAYGQWDTTKLVESIRVLLETWGTHRDTPVGQTVAKWDDEDLLGSLETVLRSCERAGLKGAARLTIGDRVHGRLQSFGHPDTPTIAETGLADWAPPEAGFLQLSSFDSLADWMSKYLHDAEERHAKQSLKASLKGEDAKSETLDAMTTRYYEDFAKFRKLIYESSYEAFSPPAAMIVRREGVVEDASVSFTMEDSPNRVALKGASAPEFAFVGRMRDPSKARKFFALVWGELLNGFAARPSGPAMTAGDLGLNVPTALFVAPETPPAGSGRVQVASSGEPLVHVMIVEDWLILSTSKQLSQSVLEAKRGGSGDRHELPSAAGAGLVGYGFYEPTEIAAMARNFGGLFKPATDPEDERISVQGEVAEVFAEVMAPLTGVSEFMARGCESFSRIEWLTRQANDTRRTDLVLEFAE